MRLEELALPKRKNMDQEEIYQLAEAMAAARQMSLARYLDWLVPCDLFREPQTALALALEAALATSVGRGPALRGW